MENNHFERVETFFALKFLLNSFKFVFKCNFSILNFELSNNVFESHTLWIFWVENLQQIQAKTWKLLVKCWKWGKSRKITSSTKNVEKLRFLAESISLQVGKQSF